MSEQRRLAAIMAVDVAGYSRLMGEDEAGTARAVREHREAARPIVAAHGGRIVKTMGDGVLLEFPSVVAAVECAIAVQRLMGERNADVPEARRIVYRIGVNLGDVLIEGDDILGDGVNIAARLEGTAEPGGICLSEDAWRQVRGKIDAVFADLGDRELKNIARPVRVYAVAPPSSPSPPHGGGEGRDEVGDSRARDTTSPSRAVGAGPSLSATRRGDDDPPRLSIVVLPFANIGGDLEQDYFVDGVTESLTTDLSRIGGSFVIARNTAFTYKGKSVDVKQIGRELNVRYVLEGSVQKGGNRLRVNVQLIDAETGNHLWAERFDKPVADLFDMQDEIVGRLANQLNTELVAVEARRAAQSPNPDSMDLYFQGRVLLNSAPNAENLTKARALFERALALDSRNVEALSGIATAEFLFAAAAMEDMPAHFAAAEAAAEKALALAPNHVLTHHALAYTYLLTGRIAQAIATAERTLAIDRNMAAAHATIGHAKSFAGHNEEMEAHVLEALRLSPKDSRAGHWMFLAGTAKTLLGQDEEAVAWLRRSIETFRYSPQTHFVLAVALTYLGRIDEARAAAQAGLALDPAFTIARFRALTAAASDNPINLPLVERLHDGMRKAGLPEG
jgi:TolB-like protein/class 3 adenylate cyclase/Tfp pilus assembly protein PilF